MILCDTNVLVALVDNSDELNTDAQRDLAALSGQLFFVTEPVLGEALHLLVSHVHRARLLKYLTLTPIVLDPQIDTRELIVPIFTWLERYSDHSPDWADAHLAVLAGSDRRLKIWTYDKEFQTIWKRPDGSRIPVVGKRLR